jgi:hypothetical protein
MNFSISVTIGLNEYDAKVDEYCKDARNDTDYTTLIDAIQEELEQIDGVARVMFNHSSWMTVDFGTDSFNKVEREIEVVKEEIRRVFAKYGVE